MLSIDFGAIAFFAISQTIWHIQMYTICAIQFIFALNMRRNVMENLIIMGIITRQIIFNKIGCNIYSANSHRLGQRDQI